MTRRQSRQIHVGSVPVGGGAPVSIQSMTCTPTQDATATLAQINTLARVGCQIVRVAVPDEEAVNALPTIVEGATLPVVADIHFDHNLALASIEAGVAGLRINPGNIGSRERVAEVVAAARDRNCPIRIGVNAGSLEKHWREKVGRGEIDLSGAMVESALGHVGILESLEFHEIKISMKASDVRTTVEAYRRLAGRCDYPFHVGITEAGTPRRGTVKSAAGIGVLLMEGLCDTIRVSLTGPVDEEVRVARCLLQAMGERPGEPEMVSCPTCGRVSIDIQRVANAIEEILEDVHLPVKVAVMGCEVNGPGEAREADLGLTGSHGRVIIFRKGKVVRRCETSEMLDVFHEELDKVLDEKTRGG